MVLSNIIIGNCHSNFIMNIFVIVIEFYVNSFELKIIFKKRCFFLIFGLKIVLISLL